MVYLKAACTNWKIRSLASHPPLRNTDPLNRSLWTELSAVIATLDNPSQAIRMVSNRGCQRLREDKFMVLSYNNRLVLDWSIPEQVFDKIFAEYSMRERRLSRTAYLSFFTLERDFKMRAGVLFIVPSVQISGLEILSSASCRLMFWGIAISWPVSGVKTFSWLALSLIIIFNLCNYKRKLADIRLFCSTLTKKSYKIARNCHFALYYHAITNFENIF
jgi:hypothetical protein